VAEWTTANAVELGEHGDALLFQRWTLCLEFPRSIPEWIATAAVTDRLRTIDREIACPWEVDDRNLRWVWPRLRRMT
jgi:hypothetical protein